MRTTYFVQLSGLALASALVAGCSIEFPNPGDDNSEAIAAAVVAPALPFPHHVTYPAPVIKPNNFTQAQLDQQVQSYYAAWKARYFREVANTNPIQAYSYYNLEHVNSPRSAVTVSEQHGYAMVIEAYLGNQTDFDKMVAFYKAHPSLYAVPNADISPPDHMMCWQETINSKGVVSNVAKGPDSATDGDEDIAYSLLLADRQWGSTGAYNYKQMALDLIKDHPRVMIGSTALPGVVADPVLWLGDWTIHQRNTGTSQWLGATRPSDWMFDHYKSFINVLNANGSAQDASTFQSMVNLMYSISNRINTVFSPSTGLMPDFILKSTNGVYSETGTYNPPAGKLLEGTTDPTYSWNSCRVPWRFGTDYVINGNSQLKAQLQKLNAFIKQASAGNPANVRTGYKLDGTATGSGTDLAFTSPLLVSNMVPKADGTFDQAWLNALWTYVNSNTMTDNTDCYGNTIKLQCMIIASGNWWQP
jgi:endoglucanase